MVEKCAKYWKGITINKAKNSISKQQRKSISNPQAGKIQHHSVDGDQEVETWAHWYITLPHQGRAFYRAHRPTYVRVFMPPSFQIHPPCSELVHDLQHVVNKWNLFTADLCNQTQEARSHRKVSHLNSSRSTWLWHKGDHLLAFPRPIMRTLSWFYPILEFTVPNSFLIRFCTTDIKLPCFGNCCPKTKPLKLKWLSWEAILKNKLS